MEIEERIGLMVALGEKIKNLRDEEMQDVYQKAALENGWFVQRSVQQAIEGILLFLEETKLKNWVSAYQITDQRKTVGIVMAGNIPLVGFHDLLTTFISGNKVAVKTSSQDTILIKKIISWLQEIDPRATELIQLVDRLNDVEAVIATGSDNSARYFRYYFKKKPHIIRANRTSIAILTGKETREQIFNLAEDIFLYFGLGCRNVSKIFVPTGFDFSHFLDVLGETDYTKLMHHSKYFNNYEYNKSILLINEEPHFDNGFLLIKEDKALVSPTSVLYYEYYDSLPQLQLLLAEQADKIQCIVGSEDILDGTIPFGKAQQPELTDYADGVDTMEFLIGLK